MQNTHSTLLREYKCIQVPTQEAQEEQEAEHRKPKLDSLMRFAHVPEAHQDKNYEHGQQY